MNTKIIAKITLNYNDERFVEALANAVNPDNLFAPEGLVIKTISDHTSLITTIRLENGVKTLFSTIDDLLSCVQIAEQTVMQLRKLER
jgi:cell division septal protein FtsQ